MSDTGNVDLKTANEEVDEIDAAFCESVGIGAHGSEIHRALLKQEPLTYVQPILTKFRLMCQRLM